MRPARHRDSGHSLVGPQLGTQGLSQGGYFLSFFTNACHSMGPLLVVSGEVKKKKN